MQHRLIRTTFIIGTLLLCTVLFVHLTNNETPSQVVLATIPTVAYTTKTTGPLEPENTYLELLQTPGLATTSREKINTNIHEAAFSNSCFYSKPFDRKKIIDYLNALESDQYIDPDTLNDEALLLLYSTLIPHEISGDFLTSYNKNGLLSITHQTYDSYCDPDTRTIQGSTNYYTYDLISGERLALTDMIKDTTALRDSLREKITTTYDFLTTLHTEEEDPTITCYASLLHDSTILTNESYLQLVSFRLTTDQLEIIPNDYPSAITGVCSGTSIPFQYSEITRYLKPESPLQRTISSTK